MNDCLLLRDAALSSGDKVGGSVFSGMVVSSRGIVGARVVGDLVGTKVVGMAVGVAVATHSGANNLKSLKANPKAPEICSSQNVASDFVSHIFPTERPSAHN